MAWKVFVDINLFGEAERSDRRFREILLAIQRDLEIKGPSALGIAEGRFGIRYGSVQRGRDIWIVTIEVRASRTLIVRTAWSFPKPNWVL